MFTAAVTFGTYDLLGGAGAAQRYDVWSWQAETVFCFGSVASTLSSLCFTAPRASTGPTEPSSQCLPGALLPWVKRRGYEVATGLDLVPSFRIDTECNWRATSSNGST